ncbi:TVP38/TMEM64 family membrane protein [Picochlorum sp. SENEW3]|nr:TVP38/TMEM64 family membrane protein [Picochlorum sp. SENEW3]
MANTSVTRSGGMSPMTPRQRKCRTPQIAFGAVLVLGAIIVGMNFSPDKALLLLDWVSEHRKEGSALFMFAYIAGVVFMLPAMVMSMASGAIFGMVAGTAMSWFGSSVGQVIAFIAGRYVFKDAVVSYLTKQFPKWTAIDAAMAREGWKLVTLLRLSPIAPWNILNYALSVTSVSFSTYTLASSVSILPYLLLFVYFGSMARNLADVFTGETNLDSKATIVMGSGSGIALVGLVWYATHVSRKAMGDALREHANDLPHEITHDDDVVQLLGGQNSNDLENADLEEDVSSFSRVLYDNVAEQKSVELAERNS